MLAAGLSALFGLAQAGEEPHWGYSGEEGPEHWAKLSAQYRGCSGRNQSPIDLIGFTEAELEPIQFAYQAGGREILNNGRTIQVSYAPGSSIRVDGKTFHLQQIHFHAPSEHRIEGEAFRMEGHLVHAETDGNLAVVALMFVEGEANAALSQAWAAMPRQPGQKNPLAFPIAAEDLLPADRDYYRYSGSLTTPPCTEGVRWLVMKRQISASKEQIDQFVNIMGQPNNRPIQPINARTALE